MVERWFSGTTIRRSFPVRGPKGGVLFLSLMLMVMMVIGCSGNADADLRDSNGPEGDLLQTTRELIAFVETGDIRIEGTPDSSVALDRLLQLEAELLDGSLLTVYLADDIGQSDLRAG